MRRSFFGWFFFFSFAQADHIASVTCHLQINKDGSLAVHETITTYLSWKRGMTRSLPTRYSSFGFSYQIPFTIHAVTRDGKKEPYHIEQNYNGFTLYLGNRSHILSPGTYTYTIAYTTNRQLYFGTDNDALYWNVFSANQMTTHHVTATVTLPEPVNFLKNLEIYAYTGKPNSRYDQGSAYKARYLSNTTVEFTSTRPLLPGEAFTISVSFPKGIVNEPTLVQKSKWFLQDNFLILLMLLSWLLVIALYVRQYFILRRQQKPIVPLFEPPADISPEEARYIINKGVFDDKIVTTSIMRLATEGFCTIIQNKGGWFTEATFTLEQTEKVPSTNTLQTQVFTTLFKGKEKITLTSKTTVAIQQIVYLLKQWLEKTYRSEFVYPQKTIFIAGSISVLTSIAIITFISITSKASELFITPFIGVSIVIHAFLAPLLLRSYSDKLQPVYEALMGFQMFLSITEKDRLERLNAPKQTVQLFEKYLPYAVALDVEEKWAAAFATLFNQMERAGNPYRPNWYYGKRPFHVYTVSSFTKQVTGTIRISSSGVRPGLASGRRGSGRAGGGSGGGGIGSW